MLAKVVAGADVKDNIRGAFGLSNLEVALVKVSFVLLYCLCAPVVGWAGDRHSRKWIMVGGGLVSAAGSVAFSFMPGGGENKWAPFAFRSLAGAGEACVLALGASIISDTFAPPVRAFMIAVYFLPTAVGTYCSIGSSCPLST